MYGKCQFGGWMHPQINELLSTYAAFDGHPRPIERLNAFKDRWTAIYICQFSTDVKSRSQGWMHPQIKELRDMSAAFDGHQMPIRRLNEIQKSMNCKIHLSIIHGCQEPTTNLNASTHQCLFKYNHRFWWTPSANSQVDSIQTSMTCEIHLLHVSFVHVCQAPIPRLNAYTNQWNAKYICRFWWASNVKLKVKRMRVSINC
jgi:hypothetical protein